MREAETSVVVLWNTAAGLQAGNAGDRLCVRRSRIIVEYELPKSAGRIMVVEVAGMGSFHCQSRHPEICVLNTENVADGMQLARWIFEMYVEVEAQECTPPPKPDLAGEAFGLLRLALFQGVRTERVAARRQR